LNLAQTVKEIICVFSEEKIPRPFASAKVNFSIDAKDCSHCFCHNENYKTVVWLDPGQIVIGIVIPFILKRKLPGPPQI
jgi:hypothetical protein